MTYQEFKDFLIGFLWRTNDQVLIANLDRLIVMGTSELNRKLNIEFREVSTEITVTDNFFPLPADYNSINALSDVDYIYTKTSANNLATYRAENRQNERVYDIKGTNVHLVQKYTVENPNVMCLDYLTSLPDYQATDASWVADQYLDCYVYTVLRHSAMFLMDDDRVPMWEKESSKAIEDIIEYDKHRRSTSVYEARQQPTYPRTQRKVHSRY